MPVYGRTYSKPFIWQGDPTSAPINAAGPVPTTLVVDSPSPSPSRSTVLTLQGGIDTPVASTPTPAAIIVQAVAPPPQRTAVTLAAASADIYFSGPLVATSTPPLPRPPFVITQVAPAPDVTPVSTTTAASLVVTQQPPPARALVLTWQQLQDGFVPPAGGAVPITLVVTRAQPAQPAPDVMTTSAAPDQPFTATPAPLTVEALQPFGRSASQVIRQLQDGATIPAGGPVPVALVITQPVRPAWSSVLVLRAPGIAGPVGPAVTYAPIDGGRARGASSGYVASASAGTLSQRGVNLGG